MNQVYVHVSGGIADYEVTAGDVDVILIDWDNIDDKYAEADIEDLWGLRPVIARIADPKLRAIVRQRLYEAIREIILDERMDAEREQQAKEARLEEARGVLRAAGEL